jgi:hypothetical protein
MATEQNFSIEKGRTGNIVVTVTGVSSWTGINAKLFATDVKGNPILMTLIGTIDAPNNKITFPYLYADTANITQDNLYYEVVIYKTDKTYVKTTDYGLINLETGVKLDPTV